jgi:hypothetical protein
VVSPETPAPITSARETGSDELDHIKRLARVRVAGPPVQRNDRLTLALGVDSTHTKCYPKSEGMKLKTIGREGQLERLCNWYSQRGSEGRVRLLDALCEQYGYHWKHAIQLLNGSAVARKSPPGLGEVRVYQPAGGADLDGW